MQELEKLQTYLLWLIIGFFVFRYFLPSLSSYLKEKLTGRDEEEKFDLNDMVNRKQEVFDRIADHSKPAFERMVNLSDDQDSKDLLKEIYWGAGPRSLDILTEAQRLIPETQVTWGQLRNSYFELLKLDSFNQSEEFVSFQTWQRVLIDFTANKDNLQTPDLKDQLVKKYKNQSQFE